jgi:hypothetical protein
MADGLQHCRMERQCEISAGDLCMFLLSAEKTAIEISVSSCHTILSKGLKIYRLPTHHTKNADAKTNIST